MGTEARRVLLLGDDSHADFHEAVQWLTSCTELTIAPSLADGIERLTCPPLTDVVVVAQSAPGQFSATDIERLHRASPLTRLVGLLGSWCEGEVRTGKPWPGVVRIYWHQWRARMIPELTARCSGIWGLPRTATIDERLAATVDRLPIAKTNRGVIAVHCPTLTMFQSLRDACSLGGYATIWYQPTQSPQASGVVAAIWDGVSGEDCRSADLHEVVQRHRLAPVIVVLDFVRRQDQAAALQAGAKAVLAKPFLVADLLWHLDHAIQIKSMHDTPVHAA